MRSLFSRGCRRLSGRQAGQPEARPARVQRPRLEVLEERTLLAGVTAHVNAAMEAAHAPTVTQSGHMLPPNAKRSSYRSIRSADSETTMDGNSVVLEEEMMKMTDARMNYDAAISFYQKSLNMLRLAARAPGR